MLCNCHGMVYLDCPNYKRTRRAPNADPPRTYSQVELDAAVQEARRDELSHIDDKTTLMIWRDAYPSQYGRLNKQLTVQMRMDELDAPAKGESDGH